MYAMRQARWAARRGERWLRQRFQTSALILMYHRVVELPSDPQMLAVTPEHFDEHLDVLRGSARVLRLAELVKSMREASVPKGAVVITFDDGYADNLLAARPLLEKHDLPATVFVTAGRLGCQQEFWWDELERLVLQPGSLPASLTLTAGEAAHRWDLDGAANYDASMFERHRKWDVGNPDDPTGRQHLYRSLYDLVHPLSRETRESVLEQLRRWANDSGAARPSHRTLTVDELRRLDQGELIEIGAHTLNHPALARLLEAEQRWEIQQSRLRLEDILDRPVTTFAYPFGSATRQTLGLVGEAGYLAACSSRPDVVWPPTDIFDLPRVVVRDVDGESFARTLRYWFNG